MMTLVEIISRAFQVGLDASMKSCILLALAAIVSICSRRLSAATRHRIWSLAFASCLVMPVVCLCLPQIQIPMLPPSPFSVAPPPKDSPGESPFVSRDPFPSVGLPIGAMQTQAPSTARNASPERRDSITSPAPAPQRTASAAPFPVVPLAILSTWFLGAAGIWCVLIAASLQVVRRRRRSTPAPDAWRRSLDDVRAKLRSAQRVHIVCDAASAIPIAAGILRPVVFMPRQAECWSRDSMRYALIHEFIHIERRDVLWQFLGQLTAGLYWFNPLVWYGVHRLRMERERACDDCVVQLTGRASDYATQLVEIARSVRALGPMMPAVAMSQASDLEYRLVDMFDRARSHVPLSRKMANRLTIAATVFLLLLAAIKPVARVVESEARAHAPPEPAAAHPPEGPVQDAKQGEKATPADRPKMKVKVLDEAGKPIVGANIHASIWEIDPAKRGDFPNRDYVADENGIANIERPEALRILRLWASHRDFVCLFAHWEEGEHDNGRRLPAEFTFTLPRGIEIGGRIVDEEGKPVEGVRVEATLQDETPFEPGRSNVLYNIWLATNEDAAVSDRDGRWAVKNVPAVMDRDGKNRVWLRFNHPDYLPFPGDNNADRTHLSPDAMRQRTLQTTLARGVRLEGIIRDPAGKPVPGAIVIRGDNPYSEWGSQEVVADDQGRYRLPALPPGKLRVTVVAKGWMPQMREVDVAPESNQADFQLEAGRTLKLNIVDQTGLSVSDCYVSIQEWRGKQSLYNHRHPTVINTGIPWRTDEQGIYVWDWAPNDAVKYQIGKPGFLYHSVVLTASDEEQTITLKAQSKVAGVVTDAVSGKAIRRFTVHPMLVFRKNFYGQDQGDVQNGAQGRFALNLDRTDVPYCLVVEADGYRAGVGRTFQISDGEHREVFKLEAAPLLKGRILDPQGRPLKGAQVHFVTIMSPLQYDSDEQFMGRSPYVTEEDGQFQFVPHSGPYKLVATHAEGYCRVEFDEDAQPGDIQLQPWARIEGTLSQEGRPVPNASILVQILPEQPSDETFLRESRQTKTNADGSFVFAKVPPTRIVIRPHLSVWSEHPITSSRHVPLDLKPGENVKLDFGGRGARITGQVVLQGDVPEEFDLNYSLNFLVRRGSRLPPLAKLQPADKIAEPAWSEALLRSAEGEQLMLNYERHFVRLRQDGQFLVNGVQPGEYDFTISVYDRPQGCLIDPIAIKVIPVVIKPADVDRGSLSLPDITIPFPERAKIGEPLPDLTLRLSKGETVSLGKSQGKPVILHGWATWCEPCVKALPQLKELRERLPEEKLAMVGINLDEDAASAGVFAAKEKLSWQHAYVGHKSAAARRLGLSSVPTYLVVSADGKLLIRTTDWASAEAELNKLVAP